MQMNNIVDICNKDSIYCYKSEVILFQTYLVSQLCVYLADGCNGLCYTFRFILTARMIVDFLCLIRVEKLTLVTGNTVIKSVKYLNIWKFPHVIPVISREELDNCTSHRLICLRRESKGTCNNWIGNRLLGLELPITDQLIIEQGRLRTTDQLQKFR